MNAIDGFLCTLPRYLIFCGLDLLHTLSLSLSYSLFLPLTHCLPVSLPLTLCLRPTLSVYLSLSLPPSIFLCIVLNLSLVYILDLLATFKHSLSLSLKFLFSNYPRSFFHLCSLYLPFCLIF